MLERFMEVVICKDAAQVGAVAAAKVAQVARRVGPSVVLGVATGSSPLALYSELAALVAAGSIDLSHASAFALDEYVGLPQGHPESYAEVIRRTVTEPLGLDPSRVHVPDGFADDLALAAEQYEAAIAAAGGVDVQILGIGANGHIGFNEPTSSLSSRTRIKILTPRTRADNARFFDSPEQVPIHCLTQGLGTILDAREVVLVANGQSKADAVRAAVEGPLTAMVPASVLQLHRFATVVVDEAAAAGLTTGDFHAFIRDNKPEWQRY
ncbi:glucosamine-6-phosphate deaminase [Propionibacterium sp. oral taxon 192 str. F0372]|nr:glucosamine-6-phosphate deaminase [Propionibacterium sp. oral taxon 192 str. F0372]